MRKVCRLLFVGLWAASMGWSGFIGRTAEGHRPFTLPVEAVMSRYAVVAISGYGKTILGTVMAEELIKLNQVFCVLDVVGVGQ